MLNAGLYWAAHLASAQHGAMLVEVVGQPHRLGSSRPLSASAASACTSAPVVGGSIDSRVDLESKLMAHSPKMTNCDVQSGTGWKTISIGEALERNERNGRCVECHMPVRAHRLANNGMAAHFEHRERNARCPFSAGVGVPSASQAPQLRKPLVSELQRQPPPVKSLSVDDLADLRRRLTALLDSFDTASRAQGEGIRKRINRLSHDGGPIPREIAALMTTITEMRNSAEYQLKVLSGSECAAVRHAWQSIQEWAQLARRK